MIKTLKFLTPYIFLLFTFQAYGQGNIDPLIKEANEAFKNGAYSKAKGLYSELLALEPNDPNFNYRLGACMLMSEASKQPAMKYLEFACGEYNVDEEAYFYYGLGFHYTYNFSQAIKWYERFKKSASNKQVAIYNVDQNIEMARNGQGLLKTFSQPEVRKAYQASDNNFYKSYKIDKTIHGLATVPSDLKSKIDLKKKYEGIMMVHKTLNIIFYTSYGEVGETGIDIYSAQINEDGEIGNPTKLPESINTQFDDAFPFLSTDGKTFYFASTGHNSMGGYDIFKAATADGVGFDQVENLDYSINTPSDEFLMAENLKEDLKIFSSDRTSDEGRVSVYEVGFNIPMVSYTFISGKFWAPNTKSAQIKLELAQKEVDALYTNKSTGEYFLKIPVDKTYVFVVEPTGDVDAYEGNVTVPEGIKGRIVRQEIEVIEEESGNRLEIRNFFEEDLKDDGRGMFAQYLTDNQDLEDQIGVDELASIDMVLDLLNQYNAQIEDNLSNYYDGLGTLSQMIKDKQAVTDQDQLLLEQNPDDESLAKDYEKHAYELTALTEMYDLLNAELSKTKEQFAVAQELTPPVQEAATVGAKEINAAWNKYKEEVGYIERSEPVYLALVKLRELQASKRELVKAAEASGNEYYDDIAAIEKDIRYYKNQSNQTKDKQLKATFEDEVVYLEEELVTTQNAYHNKLKETAELEKEATFYKSVVSAAEQMVDDIEVQSYEVFDTDQIAVSNAQASKETISNFYQYSSGGEDGAIAEATGEVEVSNFWTIATLGQQMDVYLNSDATGSEARSKQKAAIEQTLNYYLDNPSDLDDAELASLEEMKTSWRDYQESTQYVQDDIEYLNSLLADENAKLSKEGEIEAVFAAIYSAEKLTKQQKEQLDNAEEEWKNYQEIGNTPKASSSTFNDFYFGIEDYKSSVSKNDVGNTHAQREQIDQELLALSDEDLGEGQIDSLTHYWNSVKYSDEAVQAELLYLSGEIQNSEESESTLEEIKNNLYALESHMSAQQMNSETYLNLKTELEVGKSTGIDDTGIQAALAAYQEAVSTNGVEEIHTQRLTLTEYYENGAAMAGIEGTESDSISMALTQALFANAPVEAELKYINRQLDEEGFDTPQLDSLSLALQYLKDNAIDEVDETLFQQTNDKLLALSGSNPLTEDEVQVLTVINDYHFQIDSIYKADVRKNEKNQALNDLLAEIEAGKTNWETQDSDKIEQEEALLVAALNATKWLVEDKDQSEVYDLASPEVKTWIDSLNLAIETSSEEETKVQALTAIDNYLISDRTLADNDLLALMVLNKTLETSVKEVETPDAQSELEFVELDQIEEEIALKLNNSQIQREDVEQYYETLLNHSEPTDSLNYALFIEAFDQLAEEEKEELLQNWSTQAELSEVSEEVMTLNEINIDYDFPGQDSDQQKVLQEDYTNFDTEFNNLLPTLIAVQSDEESTTEQVLLSHILQEELEGKREELVAVRVTWPTQANLASMTVASSHDESENINTIIESIDQAKTNSTFDQISETQKDNWKTELSNFKESTDLASDQMIASVYLAALEMHSTPDTDSNTQQLAEEYTSKLNEIANEIPNPQTASDYRSLEVSYLSLLDEIEVAMTNAPVENSGELTALKSDVERELNQVRRELDAIEGTEFAQQQNSVPTAYTDEQVEIILGVPAELTAINSLLENNEWTEAELDSLYAQRLLILNAKKEEVEQALAGYDGIYSSDLENLNVLLQEQIAAGNPYAKPIVPLQSALANEVVENGNFVSSEDLVADWTKAATPEIAENTKEKELEEALETEATYVSSVDSLTTLIEQTKKKKTKRALAQELAMVEDSLAVQSLKVEEIKKNKKAMEAWPKIIWKKPLDNELQAQAEKDFKTAEKEYFRWSDSVETTQVLLDQTKKKKTRKLLETQLAEYKKERKKAAVIYESKRDLKEQLAEDYEDLLKESSPYGDTLLFTLPEYTFVLSEEEQKAIGMDPVYMMRKTNFNLAQSNEHQVNLLQSEIDSLDIALQTFESQYNQLVALSEAQGGLSEKDQEKMLSLLADWEVALKARKVKSQEIEALENEQFYLLNQSDQALLALDDSIKVSHIIAMENMERVGVTTPEMETDTNQSQLVEDQFVINEQSASTNTTEVKEVSLSGLIFKVQIGAFRNAIDESTFDVFNPVTKEFVDNTWTKYFAGMFKAEQTATMARDNIRTLGYSDAFVVAYYNGQRISIQRAREIAAGNTAALAGLPVSNTNTTSNPSQNTDSPVAQPSELKAVTERSKVFLTVQVGVYGGTVVPDVLNPFESLNSERMDNGWIRYSSGVYTDLESARTAKQEAVNKGITDAFITGYFNGERIAVDEALRLLQEQENITEEQAVVEETIETENTIEDLSNASKGTPGSGNYSVRLGPYEDGVPTAAANEILKFGSIGVKRKVQFGKTSYLIGNFDNFEDAEKLLQLLISKALNNPTIIENKEQ